MLIKLIPFSVIILGEKDKFLLNELKTELSGILAWAVSGCLDWQKKGRRGETPGVIGLALSTPSQPSGCPLPLDFGVLLPGSGPVSHCMFRCWPTYHRHSGLRQRCPGWLPGLG